MPGAALGLAEENNEAAFKKVTLPYQYHSRVQLAINTHRYVSRDRIIWLLRAGKIDYG